MNILAVDGDAERLAKTGALLQKLFPKAAVMAQGDALMAGKHVFNNPVDILFAAWDMKRMNGLQMAAFVRRLHPQAWVFLTSCPEQCGGGCALEDEADGFLTGSLNEAQLHLAMIKAEQNRSGKTGKTERIGDHAITLERTNA